MKFAETLGDKNALGKIKEDNELERENKKKKEKISN